MKRAHIQPVVFATRNQKRKHRSLTLDTVFAIASALIVIGLGLLTILTIPQQ